MQKASWRRRSLPEGDFIMCVPLRQTSADLAREYTVCSYFPLPVPYRKADPAAGLLAAVRAAGKSDFGELSAFYLKKSQAEEEREGRRQ